MRGLLAGILLLASFAGCVSTSAPGAELQANAALGMDAEGFAPALFKTFSFQEVDLGVEDGLRLHADVYLPDVPLEAGAPTKFPTILLLSPYWGGGTQGQPVLGYMPYDFLVQRLLPRGYAIVYGDLGGNGGSSGCWDFMGPVERKASVAMVEAIAAQEWSDGKVGMMGLSYDGMTQIMAASDQAPHLVTVVPASPLTHAYAGLHQGGVHYGGNWHTTIASYEQSTLLPSTNPARRDGWLETLQASPACIADDHLGDLPTNEYNAWYQARDYRALGADVKASVFYMQGFLDPAVKPDNFGEWFAGVTTLKKATLGFWYHQYPTADNAGRDDMYLTLHRWFDHELKGIQNGIELEPAIDVQDSQGAWRHEAAWPPADVAPRQFYLSADGALVADEPKNGQVSFGGALGATDLVVPQSAGVATFGQFAFPKGLRIAGEPRLDLTLASDRPTGVVIARLYDGDRLISQGAYNLQFAAGLEKAMPLTPMSPVTVSFPMYPTDWHVVDGSSLRVELAVQDDRMWYDPDAGLGTLTLTAGETAILTLPTIERGADAPFLVSCGKSLKEEIKGCWQDLKDQGVVDT